MQRVVDVDDATCRRIDAAPETERLRRCDDRAMRATPERTLRTASKLPTVNGDFSTWLGRERHLSGCLARNQPNSADIGTRRNLSPPIAAPPCASD